jgi:hypothetical protein
MMSFKQHVNKESNINRARTLRRMFQDEQESSPAAKLLSNNLAFALLFNSNSHFQNQEKGYN